MMDDKGMTASSHGLSPALRAQEKAVEVPADVMVRVRAFLKAYMFAPDDTDIELKAGAAADGEPAIGIIMNGKLHAFMVREAAVLSEVLEATMHQFAGTKEVAGFPDMIMAIRHATKESSRQRLDQPRGLSASEGHTNE